MNRCQTGRMVWQRRDSGSVGAGASRVPWRSVARGCCLRDRESDRQTVGIL